MAQIKAHYVAFLCVGVIQNTPAESGESSTESWYSNQPTGAYSYADSLSLPLKAAK